MQQQIAQCDLKIEQQLATIATGKEPKQGPGQTSMPQEGETLKVKGGSRKRKPKDALELSLAGHLKRILGVDLTSIPGLNVLAVLSLVSEIGTNTAKWRNEKAFVSWMGLSPNKPQQQSQW